MHRLPPTCCVLAADGTPRPATNFCPCLFPTAWYAVDRSSQLMWRFLDGELPKTNLPKVE